MPALRPFLHVLAIFPAMTGLVLLAVFAGALSTYSEATAATLATQTAPPKARPDSSRGLGLMPWPASLTWGDGALRIDSAFSVAIVRHDEPRLRRGLERTVSRVAARYGRPLPALVSPRTGNARLVIDVQGSGNRVQGVNEDESYSLVVSPSRAVLRANTVVGALRGFETFVQLLGGDSTSLHIPAVTIGDTPRFKWRGLLVDVSRHFIPVEGIKRTLDGMAAVKLNVLHWHLSDDQGFRVESRRYPKLHALGSDSLYYTQEQIHDIVAYAADRGIRVVPEFDMPGHSTVYFIGYPELASIPGEYDILRKYGWGDATFDPSKEEVYTFVDRFVGEMVRLFPDAYWHIGGDEVNYRHWANSPTVQRFKRRRGYRTNEQVQAYFNRRLAAILIRHGRRMIGWDEVLHPAISKATVIQSWRGERYLTRSTAAGHRSILSAPYYLDHMKTAEEHYLADPIPPWTDLTARQQALVLGGEACMWSEHVDSLTIDSRLWPRLAAIAERFWSPREVNNVVFMYKRLRVVEQSLVAYGLQHMSSSRRLVEEMTSNPETRQAMTIMLEAIAPPTFGQRVRLQRTTPLTPLTGVLDAAIPDPWGRWETSRLVADLLADSTSVHSVVGRTAPLEASARLAAMLTRWRDAGRAVVSDISRGSNSNGNGDAVADAMLAADALARTAEIGLEALGFLHSPNPPSGDWAAPLLAELNRYEQPQGLLRIAIVPAVRRLVQAVAVSPS